MSVARLRHGFMKSAKKARVGMMLMSELERRAQIEETWARRVVFADTMAAERMAEYMARRDLARLGCYGFPEAPAVAPRPPVATARGGFAPLALPGRQIAVAHYARTASPDSLAALTAGLQAICRNAQDIYAER